MTDRAQYIVLTEDLQSRVFLRRVLTAAGANPRRIRPVPLPSEAGGGAGDAYVLAKYPREVKAFRTQAARAKTALVVQLDADTHGVADRHQQLRDALKAAAAPARATGEAIAELVPKRNIETWIHALDPSLESTLVRPLNETAEYPRLKGNESDCGRAAEAFATHAKGGPVPTVSREVPSLLDGFAEFQRVL